MRAILVGEGQLNLFKSLDDVCRYIEPPEAKTGKYVAYTEDNSRWLLTVNTEKHTGFLSSGEIDRIIPKIDIRGPEIQNEILSISREFFSRCGRKDINVNRDNIFQKIEDIFGFTA